VKKHKKLIGFAIIVALVLALLCGKSLLPQKKLTAEEKLNIAQEIYEEQQNIDIQEEPKEEAEEKTEAISPKEITKVEVVEEQENMTCSLYVWCHTALDNIEKFEENKAAIIPKDGIIFEGENIVFYEGESVFDVLLREMNNNRIHLEFTKTPGYNSAYIEGIGNLYEFDCGELSGWLYRVNGKTPGYGCSSCTVENGDVIEFLYSCNLGVDIGSYKNLSGD